MDRYPLFISDLEKFFVLTGLPGQSARHAQFLRPAGVPAGEVNHGYNERQSNFRRLITL